MSDSPSPAGASDGSAGLAALLDEFTPRSDREAADVARMRQMAAAGDPWIRSSPLHVTGSAVILHPASRRILLRWHERLQGWLQVGGHADAFEANPFQVALREGREETGLPDLIAWPDPARPVILQIVIVPVPAGKGEPVHEHADVRYILSTAHPDSSKPENPTAPLRWLSLPDALTVVTEDNLRECLERIARLLQERDGGIA